MHQGLRTELQRIAALAVFLVLAGWLNGHLLATLIVGGGLYMLWTLSRIHRLYLWLDHGAHGLPPEATGVWGDISDQLYRLQQRNERHQHSFRALAQRIRQLTNALDEGLIILDRERCLDWWNPAATRLLGLRAEDRNLPIANLIRTPKFVAFIQADAFDAPLTLPAPNNSQRILLLSANIFGDNELALVVQDITRLRNLEQMRKDFVANISHELRTPLTVLTGYIETLRGDPDIPAHWQMPLAQMAEQNNRMTLLAEDLLLLSRLESASTVPTCVPLALSDLLQPIIANALSLSEGRHKIELHCPPDLQVLGNAEELHSAFANLVYNAVKHNPEGCLITIEGSRDQAGVQLVVRDNGVGIDAKHLPRLTERFYRADGSRATQSGGTGLGLAIVKHVLLRHSASLDIYSTLGKGSRFVCRFASA